MKENKEVEIELRSWDYTCGDGCCSMYGTELIVNGVKSENQYDGDSVTQALEYTLKQLGYEPKITETYEE